MNSATGLVSVTPASFSGSVIVRVASRNALQQNVQVYAESISNSAIGKRFAQPDHRIVNRQRGNGFPAPWMFEWRGPPGPGVTGNGFGDMDTQTVSFEFEGEGVLPPTSVDLQTGSDSGSSNIDNITNAGVTHVSGRWCHQRIDGGTGERRRHDGRHRSCDRNEHRDHDEQHRRAGRWDLRDRRAANQRRRHEPVFTIANGGLRLDSTRLRDQRVNASERRQGLRTDLISSEEGSGLVYSFTAAPTGATINATTGVIDWTPVAGQIG